MLDEIQDKVGAFRSFWLTKKAVRAGEPLQDLSLQQLKEKGYQGPWLFNLTECLLAWIPAAALLGIVDFLWPREMAPAPPFLSEEDLRFFEVAAPIFYSVDSWLRTSIIPITTMVIAYIAAWGSLRRADSSKSGRTRATRAYLYIEGAYGFAADTLFAVSMGASQAAAYRDVPGSVSTLLAVATNVAFLMGLLLGLRVFGMLVPSKLFVANGYSGAVPHFWKRKPGADCGPWNKYAIAVLLAVPVALYALALLSHFVSLGIAHGLAVVKIALTG